MLIIWLLTILSKSWFAGEAENFVTDGATIATMVCECRYWCCR